LILATNKPLSELSREERIAMRSMTKLGVGVLMAVAMGGGASTALASSPQSCVGQIVAATNHNSGAIGASGNPQASAGPGYFFGPGTQDAISGVRGEFCGP
jgi:hypothetical protein